MTAIGLISDVHAAAAPVAEALSIFARQGVEHIFCAGDTAGYHDQLDETVDLLARYGVRAVLGNHDLQYLETARDGGGRAADYLRQLPMQLDTMIDGKRVYMVHAHPPDACHGGIKLRDRTGEVQADRVADWEGRLSGFSADVLIVGHTHQVYAERVGDILVVNPGSTVFNYSCAILRLPEMSVQTFALSGREIVLSWNWSDHFGKSA